MARRSLLETSLVTYLSGYGWTPPSLRVQAAAFPGCTPAATSARGRGRGGVVFDVERREDTGILVAYVAGLKASKDRKSTITVTTGREAHVEAVVKAAEIGMSIPIVVVSVDAVIDDKDLKILDHGPIAAAVVNVGDMIRRHGLEQRAQGQGKGRGIAAPVAWGVKRQTSAAGKVYEYVSLQVNLPACGVRWETLNALVELEEFIAARAEGIPV